MDEPITLFMCFLIICLFLYSFIRPVICLSIPCWQQGQCVLNLRSSRTIFFMLVIDWLIYQLINQLLYLFFIYLFVSVFIHSFIYLFIYSFLATRSVFTEPALIEDFFFLLVIDWLVYQLINQLLYLSVFCLFICLCIHSFVRWSIYCWQQGQRFLNLS